MKKALVFLIVTALAAIASAQVQQKAFEGAVDFFNCKVIELVLSDGDAAIYEAFKKSCNCFANPGYKQLQDAIPSKQSKTRQLAKEVQQIKEEKLANRSAEAIAGFLSQKVFDDYTRYPAIYAFATKRIENDDFYDLKQQLKVEITGYLQQKQGELSAPKTVSTPAMVRDSVVEAGEKIVTRAGDSVIAAAVVPASTTASNFRDSDVRVMQERLDALEWSKGTAAGFIDHTLFQVGVLVIIVFLFVWVYWKNRGAPLTNENKEEIKSFIDRKLLTKLGSLQNGGNTALPVVAAEPAFNQELEPVASQNHPVAEKEKTIPTFTTVKPVPGELDLIFTIHDEMIIAKRHQEWRTWQEKFEQYRASLSFENMDDLAEFLEIEYDVSETDSRLLRHMLVNSQSDFLQLTIDKNDTGQINITELQLEATT